jgi:hypothetical protein
MKSLPLPPTPSEPKLDSLASRVAVWWKGSRQLSEYEKLRSTMLIQREDGSRAWEATSALLGLDKLIVTKLIDVIERHMDVPPGKLYPYDPTPAVFVQPGYHYAFEEMIAQLASLLKSDARSVAERISHMRSGEELSMLVTDLVRMSSPR